MAPIRCCFDQTAVWHSDAARGPSTPSLDHLIGAGEQRRRHLEAERLGGRQIDNEIEFGWLLDWDIGCLRPAQNLIDKVGGAAKQAREVWSIRHQPSQIGRASCRERV